MNNNQQKQQFQQNMQMGSGSGLTRYRSAPTSYFATLLNSPANDGVYGRDDFEHLYKTPVSIPGAQRIFSRFMNSTETARENPPTTNMPSSSQLNSQFLPPTKAEPHEVYQPQQSDDYSLASQMMCQLHNSEASNSAVAMGNSYNGLAGSFNANHMKMGRIGDGSSSLIRHSSSPAELFANIDIENEFGAMGSFGGGTNNSNVEASSSSASRFEINFSVRYSSSGRMNPIPEIDTKGMGENSADNRLFNEYHGNNVDYITGLPMNTWDDSDSFLQEMDDENKRFSSVNALDDQVMSFSQKSSSFLFKSADAKQFGIRQNNEGGNRHVTQLSHHISLPTSSSKLSAMDKMLQDSVPCKMRAKRGFATHPRSIAERVRRTKISERIKKLQELVPNMEKQTNTSDMLDLAVDYIKDLQRQVKTLSDTHAKCSCSAK